MEHGTSRIWRCGARRTTSSTSTCASACGRSAWILRPALLRSTAAIPWRSTAPCSRPARRRDNFPARRRSPGSTCLRTRRRRDRAARRLGGEAEGRGGRRRLHRLGGRGNLSHARSRGHGPRSASGAAGTRPGATLGMVCGELHRDHGVDLRLGVGVDAIEGDGRVERVRLDDGTCIDADVVVVGIGVVPVTDWLVGSGLTLDNGVVCDETLLAAPGVTVAAGDIARWPNPLFDGEMMRLEHWTNAVEQGVAAARRLLVPDGEAASPFAPGAVRLVGPIRPQDPVRRTLHAATTRCAWSTDHSRRSASSRCSAGPGAWSAPSGSRCRRRSCGIADSSGRARRSPMRSTMAS